MKSEIGFGVADLRLADLANKATVLVRKWLPQGIPISTIMFQVDVLLGPNVDDMYA
ncbi:hypothetical protein LguiA_006453 [Lonicera macranthoides]